MTSCIVALSLLLPAQAKDAHEDLNPIYRDLRQAGLAVGADARLKLPAPLCPDGTSDKDQQALLKKVVGMEFRFDEFTRRSPVAPFRLRLTEVTAGADRSIVRKIEVVFVAYGDL